MGDAADVAPLWRKVSSHWWPGVIGVLVAALVATMLVSTSKDQPRDEDLATPDRAWVHPIWGGSTTLLADACTVGVCVADLVALPIGRPLEAVVDLQMPDTLGALSVERVWTGERTGMFGAGWESVWDVRLVAGALSGPVPAVPTGSPEPGGVVPLADGSTIGLDSLGRVDRICLDAARCVAAVREPDALRLMEEGGDIEVSLKLEAGRVKEATGPHGPITYRYEGGLLTEVRRGSEAAAYRYDAEGRLTSILENGIPRTFTYDDRGLTATVDRDGGVWSFQDGDGVTRVTHPDGAERELRFQGSMLTEVRDADRTVLLTRTIEGGRISAEDRPLDGLRYERLADGSIRVTEERVDAPPRSAVMTVDARGRVVHSTSSDGDSSVEYDRGSSRPSVITRNGAETRFEYDDRGLLLSTEDPDGYRVEVTRDEQGLPVRVTDGLLDQSFTYDAAGRVLTETVGGETATATYGSDGLPTSITDRSGLQMEVAYDAVGRLIGFDQSTTPDGAVAVPSLAESPSPSLTVLDIDEKLVGRTRYRYEGGSWATFDGFGRVMSVGSGGRTTDRSYDEAGRLTGVTHPDGRSHRLTYTPAGRVASVSDGAIRTDLTWHGDLLIGARTMDVTGSEADEVASQAWAYDSEGRLREARSGELTWSYTYNAAGLVTEIRRPTGITSYTWDDRGRPLSKTEQGLEEIYTWHAESGGLNSITRNGEQVLKVQRDVAGRPVEVGFGVDDVTRFGYDSNDRVSKVTLVDGSIVEARYDDAGRVVELGHGGDTEHWIWEGDEVAEVRVDGEDDPHLLTWLAPGVLGSVVQGGEPLVRAATDDRGRVTDVVRGEEEEPLARFDWSDAGLAMFEVDGDRVEIHRDRAHRLTGLTGGGETVDWVWDGGALRSVMLDEEQVGFEFDGGRLSRTTHDRVEEDAGAPTIISWDETGGIPVRVESPEGNVEFIYAEGGHLHQVRYGDGPTVRTVSYEGEGVSAKDAAGGLLDDLFDQQGRFDAVGGDPISGPSMPWVDDLPTELGVRRPRVISGGDVVEASLAETVPVTPMPLVSHDDLALHVAHQVVGLGGSAELPVGPDRQLHVTLTPEGADVSGLRDLVSTIGVASSVSDRLGPGPGWWDRVTGWGGSILRGVGSVGGAVWAFLTDNLVGRAVLSVTFMAASVIGHFACGVALLCMAATGSVLFVLEVLALSQGTSVLSAITAALMGPIHDMWRVTDGDWGAILSPAAMAASLTMMFSSAAVMRLIPASALAPLCNLRRMLCVSVSRFGPAADHVVDAQRNGAPRVLQVDRGGAAARRRSALRGVQARQGTDRDEYPFAVSSRRDGLSIRHIDPSSNRSLGSYLGHQLHPLPEGARFFVLPVA